MHQNAQIAVLNLNFKNFNQNHPFFSHSPSSLKSLALPVGRFWLSSTRNCSFVCSPRNLTNCWWKFQQIYNLGAVGDKDELITFWGQRSRSRPNQIHIWSKRHFREFWRSRIQTSQSQTAFPAKAYCSTVRLKS